MKLAVLLLLVFFRSSSLAQPSIGCFFSSTPAGIYSCDLALNNPDGFDNFTAIDGDHVDGFTDASVMLVEGLMQVSPLLPSIVCDTFANVREIFLELSGVKALHERNFLNCRRLEVLFLGLNEIRAVPDRVFQNSPLLATIALFANEISEISALSFVGAAPTVLELGHNQLRALDNAWLREVSGTLESLTVTGNGIAQLTANNFEGLERLRHLDISANPLGASLASSIFEPLVSLRELFMEDVGIADIDSQWFSPLVYLRDLHIGHNVVRVIPRGAFAPLERLIFLNVADNQLSELNAHSFGASLGTLTNVHAESNRISSIDPGLVGEAGSLVYLLLSDNVCVDRNFYNVAGDREDVVRELGACARDFGFVRCDFGDFELSESEFAHQLATEERNLGKSEIFNEKFTENRKNLAQTAYTCDLQIFNPTGRDTFDAVEGEHRDRHSDDDVTAVYGFAQLTRNIPAVICSTFSNLRHFLLRGSQVEELSRNSFVGCEQLVSIELDANRIHALVAGIFENNRKLQQLDLSGNEIAESPAGALDGLNLSELKLSHNQLTQFKMADTNGTLRRLHLTGNRLLRAADFETHRNLVELHLDFNDQIAVEPTAFSGLQNLQKLVLSSCNLGYIDARWFADLASLQTLRLYNNSIRDLPALAFDPLTSLFELDIAKNALEVLPAAAFGQSLTSVAVVFAEFNAIDFIDSDLVDRSYALYILFLADNRCTGANFVDVQLNRPQVERELADCFRNYRGFLACDFAVERDFYACRLRAANVNGRDDFEAIDGEHLDGADDSSVRVVNATDQFTLNVPSVLCRRFHNLHTLLLLASRVTDVDVSLCAHLEVLHLPWNRIGSLAAGAFARTSLVEIDLNFNRISSFEPATFEAVNGTLARLFLQGNFIASLPDGAFVGLRNLEHLHLSQNRLGVLAPTAFEGLARLATLFLHSNEIRELPASVFAPLASLFDLSLHSNWLGSLPAGIFAPLERLFYLDLGRNDLQRIDGDVGELPALGFLFLAANDIYAIDEGFVTRAAALFTLDLRGNICADEILAPVDVGRLAECFRNFLTPDAIACTFVDMSDSYGCLLSVFNAGGRARFAKIDGEHLEGRESGDVTAVYASGQNSRRLPAVICESFASLEAMHFAGSRLRFLDAAAFGACAQLQRLVLNFNELTEIPAEIFASSPRLRLLQAVSNDLRRIEDGAFAGTAMHTLDFSDNALGAFEAAAFERVNATLEVLHLGTNELANLAENSFSNLRHLRVLQLSYNRLSQLPALVFSPLARLESLALIDCGLHSLNADWFATLHSLSALHLSHNRLPEIPVGAFNALISARVINVAANRLTSLDARSFGLALYTLDSIYAYGNQIDAVDRLLLDDLWPLDTLMLSENVCVSENFIDVRANRTAVREALALCFENFLGI